MSSRVAYGVTARLSAVAPPFVQRGHVAAWVGVGGPREGPNGSNEWLQVGLNAGPGNVGTLYYEVARPTGIHYVELESSIPLGQQYSVAVLETAGRPSVWRVWLKGRPVSGPIYLPRSDRALTPMAIAESWDGGAPACNRYAYRFGGIALAGSPGGSWSPLKERDAEVLQDPGYHILRSLRNGFIALPTAQASHPAG